MGWNDFDDEESNQVMKPQPFEEEDWDGKSILSQPYQGSPEQKALMEKSLRDRYAEAAKTDDVDAAEAKARRGNMIASAFQGLGDYFTADAQARGGKGMRDITGGVRQAGADNIAAAKGARATRVNDVLEGDRLAQLEKDRARQTTDQAWQDKERAQKAKGYTIEDAYNDPASPQSKAIRDQYKQMFPDLAKTPGFDTMSANDIKSGLSDPLKLKESMEARQEEARQRAADRQANITAAGIVRDTNRQNHLDDVADQRAYTEKQDKLKADEKKKGTLNEIEDRRTNINQNLDLLDSMIADKGTWEATGSHNQDLDRLVDSVATDMAKLADPNSVARPAEVDQWKKNLISSGFSNSNSTARQILKNFRREVDQRADNAYNIRGIQKPTAAGQPKALHGADLPD